MGCVAFFFFSFAFSQIFVPAPVSEGGEAVEPASKLTKLAIGVEGGAQVNDAHSWRQETQV